MLSHCNTNSTCKPIWCVEDFLTLIYTQPSPLMNPATQWGSGIVGIGAKGLATGIILGKAIFPPPLTPPLLQRGGCGGGGRGGRGRRGDSPLPFIAPFIPTILFNPSIVKCSFRFIKLNACSHEKPYLNYIHRQRQSAQNSIKKNTVTLLNNYLTTTRSYWAKLTEGRAKWTTASPSRGCPIPLWGGARPAG